MAKQPKTSRTGRMFKLAGMTASVATRYTANKLKNAFSDDDKTEQNTQKSYAKMAEDITDTLGELKGAVMKIGQIASQTQDLLPKEFSDALQKLQKEAPPVDYEVIRQQIIDELGEPPETAFKQFEKEPYASASIGQVHRATTKSGIEVICKVQYPGVDRSVGSDLKQLKMTLKLGGLLKLPKESVDALFDEIKERLEEELDYVLEAQNIRKFIKFHEDDDKVLIPKVISKLSSRRVLTLEYLPGDHIDSEAMENYDESLRSELGKRLFHTLAKQLFEFQNIHGDPHPGNFAFREDGSVIIYDFGCVKALKPEIVDAYTRGIQSAISEDYEGLDSALVELGARIASVESPGGDYYKLWRDILFEPFSDIDNYDFKASDIHIRSSKQMPLFFKNMHRFKPPVDSLYIDRMISGQYWIFKQLEVKANLKPELDKYIV